VDIFNNREIAIALWVMVISVYIFSADKMEEVRESFINLLSAFFVKQIMSVLGLMLIYMSLTVYTMAEVGLWNVDQVKNTVFWGASVGFMSLFKLESIKKDKSFFKHSVLDNLKLLAVIQFIVGVYAFPLWVELLLVPVLVFIGGMRAVSETDKQYGKVKTFIDYVLSFFGLFVIAYTFYMLATNFGEFGQEKTLYDFIVPSLLTLFYLPFVFLMLVYSTYEQVFIRLGFAINDKSYRFLAKLYAVLLFNFQLSPLERWSNHVARVNIASHKELVNSFKHICKIRKAEDHPIDVPFENGWSPYKAKYFLSSEGLNTGFYNKLFDGEWSASSPMVEFGEGIIPNNFAYYVEGTEDIAKTLKIKLNVNDSSRSDSAQRKLVELAKTLSRASLDMELSETMQNALLNGESHCEYYGKKMVTISKESWPEHKFNGYDVKFVVSSI
jgi:hypothetical protein